MNKWLSISKKKNAGPLGRRLKQVRRQVKKLKAGFFLAYTLPVVLITIGQAVLKEYRKRKTPQT